MYPSLPAHASAQGRLLLAQEAVKAFYMGLAALLDERLDRPSSSLAGAAQDKRIKISRFVEAGLRVSLREGLERL
jgi:hypothetical protein